MTTPIFSPNMNLPVPVPLESPGPEYAENIQSSLNLIDSHNHTSGQGVPIPLGALSVNQNLDMAGYSVIDLTSVTLNDQLSAPSLNGSVYMSGNDLWWKDGSGAFTVQITSGNAIAGSPGSISGLFSPASAAYLSGSDTFRFQSNANVAANLDARNITLRNSTVSSYGYEVIPPTLSVNTSITMPLRPAATKIMSMTSAGIVAANIDADNSTIEIVGNNLQVKDDGITTAKILNGSVTNAKLASPNGGYGFSAQSFNAAFTGPSTAYATTNTTITTTRANSYVMAMLTNGTATVAPQSTYRVTNINDAQLRIYMITGGSFFVAASTTLASNTYYGTPIIGLIQIATPGTYTFQLQVFGVSAGSSQLQIDSMRFVLKEIF